MATTTLTKRLFFGGVLIAFSVGAAWLDGWLSANAPPGAGRLYHGAVLAGIWCVLLGLTAAEMARLLGVVASRPLALLAVGATIALAVVPWWTAGDSGAGPPPQVRDYQVTALVLAAAAVIGGVASIFSEAPAGALPRVAATVFVIVYVGLLGGFAVRLRMDVGGALGTACVLYYILVAKLSDMGAFFIGSRFGRRRFAGTLSPNKTLEGALGGVLAAAVAAYLYDRWLLGPLLTARGLVAQSLAHIVVFSLAIALLGQIGDLVESAIKRSAGAKDSGAVIPGFGGIFDITDSLLLTAPVAWSLLTLLMGLR